MSAFGARGRARRALISVANVMAETTISMGTAVGVLAVSGLPATLDAAVAIAGLGLFMRLCSASYTYEDEQRPGAGTITFDVAGSRHLDLSEGRFIVDGGVRIAAVDGYPVDDDADVQAALAEMVERHWRTAGRVRA